MLTEWRTPACKTVSGAQMLAPAGEQEGSPHWQTTTCPHGGKEWPGCLCLSLPGLRPLKVLLLLGSFWLMLFLLGGVRWERIPNAKAASGRQPGFQAPCRRGDHASAFLSALWSCKASRSFFPPLHINHSFTGFYRSERKQMDRFLTYREGGKNCRNFLARPRAIESIAHRILLKTVQPEGTEMVTGKRLASPEGEELCINQRSPDISCDLR